MISSAYKLCSKMIEDEYPVDEWNIYPFHFSDGDNWSVDDTVTCVELLRDKILPVVNLFVTARSSHRTAPGSSSKICRSTSPKKRKMITSEIKGKEAIMDSIRDFLGTGK